MMPARVSLSAVVLLVGLLGSAPGALGGVHFVPNSQAFWDFSENWTTEYGPAYRDTTEAIENLVPCTGGYALCFHSGPELLPCKVTHGGRFADCTCTVATGTYHVLITAILNYEVYQDTVTKCGPTGSGCQTPNTAPVCKAIAKGKLIPGAKLISTFSTEAREAIKNALLDPPRRGEPPPENCPNCQNCPKAPYAGCMSAPCRLTKSGDAVCSCPVFWGNFLLAQEGASCDLSGDLIPSASFIPRLLD